MLSYYNHLPLYLHNLGFVTALRLTVDPRNFGSVIVILLFESEFQRQVSFLCKNVMPLYPQHEILSIFCSHQVTGLFKVELFWFQSDRSDVKLILFGLKAEGNKLSIFYDLPLDDGKLLTHKTHPVLSGWVFTASNVD